MAGHVFISHGSDNSDEANALCGFIESRGVKCWIAPRDVRPGIDYSEELQAAIEGCAAFVVLVTDMANKSPYVRAETEMAFSCHKPIFPVRQADIKPAAGLALFLKIRHWTDAYGKYREAALDRLALELQTVVGAGTPPPPAAPEPAAPPPLPEAMPAPPPAPRPSPTPVPSQDRLEAAIGPNAAYYLARWQAMEATRSQLSWNWAACLCSLFWFAWRKMWAPAAILGLVFVALNLLSLLSTPLMVAGGLLSILAVTATGALGTGFYRQHVLRLARESATLESEAALGQLRSRGGVSVPAVLVAGLIAAGIAGGAGYYGWRQAHRGPASDDPYFRQATSGPGNAVSLDTPQVQPPAPSTPDANPGTGPNGEFDEEAMRNALQEARNMLEQQGATPDQLPDVPAN